MVKFSWTTKPCLFHPAGIHFCTQRAPQMTPGREIEGSGNCQRKCLSSLYANMSLSLSADKSYCGSRPIVGRSEDVWRRAGRTLRRIFTALSVCDCDAAPEVATSAQRGERAPHRRLAASTAARTDDGRRAERRTDGHGCERRMQAEGAEKGEDGSLRYLRFSRLSRDVELVDRLGIRFP